MQNTIKETFEPNKKQKEAIDITEGPVMLLAGPGTGKTYTLTKRVEKMLSKGIEPENILCLTFSDAASNEMKTRLIEKIGMNASGVNVSTYHSFCMDIIKQNPGDFELIDGFQMADDITKQALLKECIDEYSKNNKIEFLKDKWGNKYFYIQSIISAIETLKRERTTKEEFFDNIENLPSWAPYLNELYVEKKEREQKGKLVPTFLNKVDSQERKIGKAKEFYSIFEIYKKKLNENNLIDYSDMINFVLDKMESDERFLKETTKDYKYVLVDEYQDTSKVQNALIFNILKGAGHDNVFVVGDDDQIIYSFQGARCTNLSDFLSVYQNSKVICLEENRRSTQTILDFAQLLIENDKLRLTNHPDFNIEKKLIAKNEKIIAKDEKINFNVYSETLQEQNDITEKIASLIKNGTKPSEIAILTRKNDSLENYARLLGQKNIPYKLSKQKNALDVPAFIITYFYLKILSNAFLEQDKLFALLSNEPFKIKDDDLANLLILSRKTNDNWYKILADNLDTVFSKSEEIKKFLDIYSQLRSKKSYTPLMSFIYETITKTGILEYFINSNEEKFENTSAIQRLIDEARSYSLIHKTSTLDDFISHLDSYNKSNIKIELPKNTYQNNAVQLLTYHGSKGREFEYVFMPELTSKMFEKGTNPGGELELPIKKSVFSEDKETNKDAELVRLLFVGITRAKFALYLSYSNSIEGKSQTATKYIANLFPKADNLVKNKIFEIDENLKIFELYKNMKVEFIEGKYKNELLERTSNLIISQTSLNKYLNCPLSYFYSDILKVPVFIEDTDILSYGSSIHRSIDIMTKEAVKNGFWGKKEEMIEIFKNTMNGLEFSSSDKKEELIERGVNSINKNFNKFIEADPKYILSAEYKMQKEYGGATLKGFADRISTDNEGKINIFDFKTGSYKKVKPDEDYYNQLRFYKFLYESINPNKKVKETSLIFFEEDCKTSSPEPDLSNNEEIKEKIDFTIKNIKNLNFEATPDDNVCRFCSYKLICKLNG